MRRSAVRTERRKKHPRSNKLAFRQADARIAELAEEEKGVLSTAELQACGLTRGAIAHRERRGWLHRMHQSVYAVGHRALTDAARWLAAVKACGQTAVLSHYAAAASWGFVEWDGRDVDVTVTKQGSRRHAGIRVHRTATLERRDIVVRDGIRVTSPERTLLDLASQLSFPKLRRAVREAMAQRRISVQSLTTCLARGGPRRGSRKLARILADGYTPTRTVLEDVVLDLILAGGFERPEVNKPIFIEGRRLVPDFRWPEQHLIVEADGRQWHDHKLAREDDAERQAFLEAHGERVLRVTWHQALTKRAQTQARLSTAAAPSAAKGAKSTPGRTNPPFDAPG